MNDNNQYYLIKKKAVPEVLLKVVEAKKLLEMDKNITIQEATETVGLGRSSFYKYKDDIFPFRDDVKGKTITFVLQMNDKPGQLSKLLRIIADSKANILTIHQTIPINGMASLTLSVEIPSEGEISDLISDLERQEGVYYVKVLARE
ncbi:MAG: ACT domain-containing protein [Lachnospiraceae bacterium]|nr:ACT domain-containing protein [Lachnospiraceae bacterium]MDE6698669.1 ACT domain-containing protein [Lachnospiraceae bacterium]